MTGRAREGVWAEWIDDRCREIHRAGQWRQVRPLTGAGPRTELASTGQAVVSFASNDYLGLSQHPAVKAAAIAAVERDGTGSGASRLVVGARPEHEELEGALADWRGTEAAVLFPTGYAANVGLLDLLGEPGVRICSDALNHASLIDGCRLAGARGADVQVYPHGDVECLGRQLAGAPRAVIVTDTVFSMDGDVAPLGALLEQAEEHDALLLVDDAHKVFELPELDGLAPSVRHRVVRVGTLSKTLGSLGGFVAGPRRLVELVVNRARPFVFTTASSPADTAAAHAALRVLRSDEGASLLRDLRARIDQLRPGHPTPILPVVVGAEDDAVALSAALLDAGLLVPAIRPPTVPPGTSRLRIALSALHTAGDVARLREALDAAGYPVAPTSA